MTGLEVRAREARFGMAAVVAALVFGLAACGSDDDGDGDGANAVGNGGASAAGSAAGGDSDDPKAQVRAVFAAYVDNIYAGDYKTACGLVSDAQHRILRRNRANCVKQYEFLLGGESPGSPKPRIVKLRVTGDKAKVRAHTVGDAASRPVQLRREGGEWKIDSGVASSSRP